jgi:23S rRNA (cytidine2498-2'-O)-methyltransferase
MDTGSLVGYLAPEGFVSQLAGELGENVTQYDRLFLVKKPLQTPYWVQNGWEKPVWLPISSIGDAVKQLRAIQRNWALFPYREHRRAALIADQLPKIPGQPLLFPCGLPAHPVGAWTLLNPSTLLVSARCSSPFPMGEVHFQEPEESDEPPSQAYLKLWELFTLLQERPQPGERCLEIGASPGSWTWVLSHCGCQVTAVDRAAPHPGMLSLPKVEWSKGDGFAMTPERVGDIDWLFSDLVCYPEKLFEFVQLWLDSGRCRRFVCTLKFQGSHGYAMADAFAAIPGSRILHLYHNKHELTWIK